MTFDTVQLSGLCRELLSRFHTKMIGQTMKVRGIQIILIAIIDIYAAIAMAAPLTLRECIMQAIHHSPALSAARHDAQAVREAVTERQRALFPSLSAQTSAYEVNGAAASPFSALRVFDAENPPVNAHWGPVGIESIGVTYPLIQSGSILGLNNPPEVAAARAAVDEKLAEILLVEQKVAFDTATAYLYATWYRSEVALASRILQLSQQRLEIIQYQAQLDLRLPQDVELARAQVAAAQQAADSARLNADDSVAALAGLVGRPDDDLTIETTPAPTPWLPPVKDFLAHVMPMHPALRVQQGRIEIAQQQVRVDKAALYPSVKLNLGFTGAQNLEHFQGNTLSNFLSFIQVDIPIFDFGRRKAAIRESQERAASALDALKAIDLGLRNSISQTYSQIIDADERVTTLQTYVLKANNAAALAGAQRHEGLIDELTWVDAQLQLPAAQIALGHGQLFMQLKYAELRNLSGGIWQWLDDAAAPLPHLAANRPPVQIGTQVALASPLKHPAATQPPANRPPATQPPVQIGTQVALAPPLEHPAANRPAANRLPVQIGTQAALVGLTALKPADSSAGSAPAMRWYLFLPPRKRDHSGPDRAAPLSQWIQGRGFDTTESCQNARERILHAAPPLSYEHLMLRYADCVSANDPRITRSAEAVITTVSAVHSGEILELHFGLHGTGLSWVPSAHANEIWIDLAHARIDLPPRPLYGHEMAPVQAVHVIDEGGMRSRLVIRVTRKTDYAVGELPHELVIRLAPAGQVPNLVAPALMKIEPPGERAVPSRPLAQTAPTAAVAPPIAQRQL